MVSHAKLCKLALTEKWKDEKNQEPKVQVASEPELLPEPVTGLIGGKSDRLTL